MVNLEVVDPISLISYLWNDIGISIPEKDVQQYWRHHRQFGAKWALHSQATEETVPLGLYGDSVKVRSTYQGVEKMVGIFLSCPLFRPRSCRCSRWLLFACQEELLYKHHTLDCVYMYLVWNLNQLFNGKYPRHGFNGAPLSVQGAARAGDWVCNSHRCFQVTEIRGDWAWHKMIFRFNSSWKAGSNMPVCFKCRAYGTGPTQSLYYNIEENSPCWQTEYANVADFIAEQCPPSPCHMAKTMVTIYVLFVFAFARGGSVAVSSNITFFQIYSNNGLVTCLCLAKVPWCSSSTSTKIWSSGAACTPSTWDFAILQTVGLWCYVIKIGSKTCYLSFVVQCIFSGFTWCMWLFSWL